MEFYNHFIIGRRYGCSYGFVLVSLREFIKAGRNIANKIYVIYNWSTNRSSISLSLGEDNVAKKMSKRGQLSQIFLIVLLLGVVGIASRAQQPSGASLPNNPPAVLTSGNMITDIFLGRDSTGPYVLSWKNVDANGVVVIKNGAQLVPGAGYQFNPQAGIITFPNPLKSGDIVRVSYLLQAGSTKNTGSVALPFTLDLLKGGTNRLSLNGSYQVPGYSPGFAVSHQQGQLALGLIGSAHSSLLGNLSSKLLVNGTGGNLYTHSGFQLQQSLNEKHFGISAGFAQAGNQFNDAGQLGLQPGNQLLTAGGTFSPLAGVQAAASFRQNRTLPLSGASTLTTQLDQSLAAKIGTGAFSASRSETSVQPGAGATSSQNVTALQFSQPFGSRTNVRLGFNSSVAGQAAGAVRSQQETLSLTSRPTADIQLHSNIQHSLVPGGPQEQADLNLTYTPLPTLRLNAASNNLFAPTGQTSQHQLQLSYAVSPRLDLNSGVTMENSPGQGLLTGAIGASSKPINGLSLTGTYVNRGITGGTPETALGQPNSYNLGVGVELMRSRLQITGALAGNPVAPNGTVTPGLTRSVGLTGALGTLSFSGNYNWQRNTALSALDRAISMRMNWRLSPFDQITSSYQFQNTLGPQPFDSQSYSLAFTRNLGGDFNLSLGGTLTRYNQYPASQYRTDYQAQAQLGVRF